MSRPGVARALVAGSLLGLLPAGPAAAHEAPYDPDAARPAPYVAPERVRREIGADERRSLGEDHAEEHARTRLALRDAADYPDTTRRARLKALTESQAEANAALAPEQYGVFKEYFDSPDFAAHIALLPTGKVLLFSFERIETNPTKEPAPTNIIGPTNAGRAFLWDPAKGTGAAAFTKVTPPVVDMPDGTHSPRPAPFFCSGHSFLPNGMLGVFGGNLGSNGGSGAKLSLVFDPWTETWSRSQDMATGRWYPSVPREKTDVPRDAPVGPFKAKAPFTRDYPHLFSLRDGLVYGLDKPRAFGRTQDNTLLMPDGTLLTASGGYDIRDYGNGVLNPNADLKYRQFEMRDGQGNWKLGPAQRLPRGYHSNAVVLPDGRVVVTGDELQQLANDADITDEMNGTIEIYEPAYLHQGARPALGRAPAGPVGHNTRFEVTTSTPGQVERAVLLAPTTATHAVDTSQRHLELRIKRRAGDTLTLQAPPDAAAAPPGYYMLFLLDAKGVPSVAQWIKLGAGAPAAPLR
ncbi:galactose oxidase early set domain-containing protein [Streptomyces sp. AP-93]|uniref:galactose oxidase early set domain-containing protein n=1 Tax=Streptomyces sp. AP-93 TaxID=2929048 RepID=UPI001FAE8BB2|nr:galactose oxidase early set domain-containing protein [Streptomyces sp. AP-93]MCJ0869914.1 galactose oxidase early set domain-containing protein [Streptomyces sp. AP-93]